MFKDVQCSGPLNLDKQCGVLILPDNIVCTRSLTCKIHSMGAKRAVEGRSQPFNDLLAAYQKKNTGRTAQVIGSASHQQIDKTNQQRSAATRAKLASATTTTATAATAALTTTTAPTNAVVEVDSDEETENVFLAIKQFQPIPLGQKRYYHVRRRRAYVRLRDILLDAITPKLSGSAAAISATDPPTAIGGEFTCL
ncbi:SCA7, zinc-binding domain-containing protein [Mycotypha africana]|uniref:SCA7, zinc-binding domain-containing protein n=1 Tax=Mycotypha africana TaxID=64632 RepID=UPI002301B15A|nr:SCA7, zinc-binding domain-containing protein [Mycotypha africana]KAI8973217.1 SCA7, zinc-binding domain-containing protein [Mycotypha africana]